MAGHEEPAHLCAFCISGEPQVHTFEPAIFGLWHGGPSYVCTDLAYLETFATVKDAKQAMRDRARNGYWQPQDFHYADGRTESVLTPAVQDSSMTLWFYDPRESSDPYPDLLLEERKNGKIRKVTT